MSEEYHISQPSLFPLTRICLTCDKEKPLEDFNKNAPSKLGRRSHCKECLLKVAREKRAEELGVPVSQVIKKVFPPSDPGYKYCFACDKEKPFQMFHKKRESQDGYASRCKDCRNKRERDHYAEIPEEQRKARRHIRYTNNKEGSRRWSKKYSEKNRKRICRLQHRYRVSHPYIYREHGYKRRAIIKRASIGEEKINYQSIIDRHGMTCHICQQDIDIHAPYHSELVFDHVVPLSPRNGECQGRHSSSNLKPAHRICNSRKNNRPMQTLSEWDRRGPNL